MADNLQDLENQVDNPNGVPAENEPLPTVKLDISDDADEASSLLSMTPKGMIDLAIEKRDEMGRQIQGEFTGMGEYDKGIMTGDEQEDVRAHNQEGWDTFKAATLGLGNEIVMGTGEALALLGDLDMHWKAMNGVEQDFTNSLAEKIREHKEAFAEKYGTVHVAQENRGFEPLSAEFWGRNLPSVGSALTLMIPAKAGVSALSGLSKLSRINRALRIGGKGRSIAKGIAGATMSRFTENAMEAHEAVSSITQELTGKVNPDTGVEFTEEEIKKIAGQAGVDTWKAGWAMMLTDVYQYGKMFKGVDFARKAAKVAPTSAIKAAAQKVGGFVIRDMGSEAVEEGYQYIVSQEAQHAAKVKAGVQGKSEFMDRLYDYMEDDEFKTGMLMGAVGGGIFAAAGKVNEFRDERRETKRRMDVIDTHKKHVDAITGNAASFEQAEDIQLIKSAIEKAGTGDLDILEADLSDLLAEADEVLEEQGLDPKVYRKKVKRAQALVREVGKQHNRIMNDPSIPKELYDTTLFARMDRAAVEQQKQAVGETREFIDGMDNQVFKSNEEATADQMTRLKKLVRNGKKDKANKLAESIAEESDFYQDKTHVMESLKTSNDELHKELDEAVSKFDERIQASKDYEKKLRSKEGRAELKAEKDKRDKKRKEEAEKLAKKIEAQKKKDSKKTPEQKAVEEEREAAVEKFGEHDTGKPDGNKVFTISDKKFGGRTFVKGEVVKGKDGKKYRVGGNIKGRGVFAYELDKEGNEVKNPKTGKNKPAKKFYSMAELHPESKKPGTEEWTVNKFIFDDVKGREKKQAIQDVRTNDMATGVVKTTTVEFDNWVRDADGNFHFDGTPVALGKDEFDIDYNLAAFPLDPNKVQDVQLEHATLRSGASAILVKQDGKIISKLGRKGVEKQFDALALYISKKGGIIDAAIKDKHVTFGGNLGNVKDLRQNLKVFEGSEFLPEGKIFIGSRKPDASVIEFFAEDGSSIELPVNTENKAHLAAQGKKTGAGNTFMLIKSPNGDLVPVTLHETQAKDVTTADGRTHAQVVMDSVNELAAEIQADMDRSIDGYIQDGMTESMAIQQTIKDFEQTEEDDDQASFTNRRTSAVVDPLIRRVSQRTVTGKNGKKYKETTANYFNIRLAYEPGKVEADGQELFTRGGVQVIVTQAVDHPRSTEKKRMYTRKSTTDPAESLDIIGSRYMNTSVDMMNPKSKKALDAANGNSKQAEANAKSYVKNAIESGWFTTDVYHKRPWVNPRIHIQLDAEATAASRAGAEVVKKKPKKTSSKQKAKNQTKKSDAKAVISEMKEGVYRITDIMPEGLDKDDKEQYTTDEFVAEYLNDIISGEDLIKAIEPMIAADGSNKRFLAKARSAIISYSTDLINDAFEDGTWNTTEETSSGEIRPRKEDILDEDDPLDFDEQFDNPEIATDKQKAAGLAFNKLLAAKKKKEPAKKEEVKKEPEEKPKPSKLRGSKPNSKRNNINFVGVNPVTETKGTNKPGATSSKGKPSRRKKMNSDLMSDIQNDVKSAGDRISDKGKQETRDNKDINIKCE